MKINTLKPSQLNTSAKLSAGYFYRGREVESIKFKPQEIFGIMLVCCSHTSIFVCSQSLLKTGKIFVVNDHTKAGGMAVHRIPLVLQKIKELKKHFRCL